MNYKLKTPNWKLLLCSLSLLLSLPLHAQDLKTKATLVSEQEEISPGQVFTVAVKFEIADHWHTYWRNPGDAGFATQVKWELPPGFKAGEIQWPYPKRLPLPGDILNFGYEGEVWHLIDIKAPRELKPGSKVELKARVDWLECEDICVPGKADLRLELKTGIEGKVSGKWGPLFDAARKKIPVKSEALKVKAVRFDDKSQKVRMLQLDFGPEGKQKDVIFFPYEAGRINNAGNQILLYDGKQQTLSVPLSDEAPEFKTISGILLGDPGWEGKAVEITLDVEKARAATQAPASLPKGSFLGSLLLGFVGGLILNLMPCVFPVLGLKIMGFAKQAGHDRKRVARHGWVFSAGVLISFWILAGILLALRAGGQELGWGFQLQSPAFVYGLLLLLFAFGLNMSGVFEVGASLVGVGSNVQTSSSYGGSFLSGVLATVVATPCAAPFLAPALGAALTLPVLPSLALFTAIAAGLALPYLILSLRPELVKALPRPGAWMESFKQFLAFLLYGAAVYLLWVLDGQVGEYELLSIFFSLVLLALGCWVYGRFAGLDRPESFRKGAVFTSVLILAAAVWTGYPAGSKNITAHGGVQWEAWSPEVVEKYRAEGRIVYVDFTARWCATCQTNKKAVFSSQELLVEFQKNRVVTLKADWTNQDARITKALAEHGRSAVPFNLLYGPGKKDPMVLPELLTPGKVLEALHSLRE